VAGQLIFRIIQENQGNRSIALRYRTAGERGRRLFRNLAILSAAGAGYYFVFSRFGIGIPCLFRAVTGCLCPGCGMTHAVCAILRGDFAGAWKANALSLTLLPVLLVYLLYRAFLYVRYGGRKMRRWEILLEAGMLAVCLGYAVLRNLGGISPLAG
jgi:hypothetical protein